MRTIDYTAAAETYDHTRTHSDDVIDRFCAIVPLDASVSVLDFGCGTGNYLARIHQRFGCRCSGVEPSDGMRARACAKSADLKIEKGDHRAIPFADAAFHFAYMTDVIHHVPALSPLFRELLRVLKPAGRLCIVTESHAQIEGRFYNRYFPSLAANEKRRYPDIGEIAARAEEAGFSVVAEEDLPASPRQVTAEFIRNVAEKNWSMFRLLAMEEFERGLQTLGDDLDRTFAAPTAGDTFLWLRKNS
jgi:ubiquinone/menaquinone biosynthesis C-methylase UbiE